MDAKAAGIVAALLTLLGGFSALVTAMPSDFFTMSAKPSYAEKYYPKNELWSSLDIGNYTYWENVTIYPSISAQYWADFTENTPYYDIKFAWRWYPMAGISLVRFSYAFLGFWNIYSDMHFESYGKTVLLNLDISSHIIGNISKFSPVFDNIASVAVFFADYNTTRNDVMAALGEGHLETLIAFGWQNISRNYDVLSLMGKLLSFQAPEIFGGGTIGILLNLIIALPIWGAIATIALIIFLEILPF
jgi:hypothetical protein